VLADLPPVIEQVEGSGTRWFDTSRNLYESRRRLFSWLLLDVTDQRRAEEALRASEEKYRRLVENSRDIVYTLDLEGTFRFVSPAWTALLGHPVSEVVGRSFVPFVHPDDAPACQQFFDRVVGSGSFQERVEYRVKTVEGHWVWHTSTAGPLRDGEGRIQGLEGTSRDMSRAKEDEARIRGLLAEKDLILREVVHRLSFEALLYGLGDDATRPVQIIIDALIAHQQAGRIRYFGCSNWSVARINEAQNYARSIGHDGFVACQPLWGLAVPDRNAMQKYCPGGYYEDGYQTLHADGMTMIPYSSQSRGFFSKVANGGQAALSPDMVELYFSEQNLRKLTLIKALAERHAANINDVVLTYLTSQPLATVPIIGCSKSAQLEESVRACELQLDSGELQQLMNA